jgi:hypothetical protein
MATVLKSSRRSNCIPVYSLIHELSPRSDEKKDSNRQTICADEAFIGKPAVAAMLD